MRVSCDPLLLDPPHVPPRKMPAIRLSPLEPPSTGTLYGVPDGLCTLPSGLSMSDFLKLYFYDTGLAANLLGIGRATGHCMQSRSNRPPRTKQAPSRIWKILHQSWAWMQIIGLRSIAATNFSPHATAECRTSVVSGIWSCKTRGARVKTHASPSKGVSLHWEWLALPCPACYATLQGHVPAHQYDEPAA